MAANTKAPTHGTLMAFPAILTLEECEALVVRNFGALQAFACLPFTGTTCVAIISSGDMNRRSTFRVYLRISIEVCLQIVMFHGYLRWSFSPIQTWWVFVYPHIALLQRRPEFVVNVISEPSTGLTRALPVRTRCIRSATCQSLSRAL